MGDDDTQAALRTMSGSIGGLDATVKHMVKTWQSQEVSATAGRRALHAKVDALRGDLNTFNGQLAGVIRDVAAMKPVVDRIRELKSEARGVSKAARWLWGAGGLLIGLASWLAPHLHVGLAVTQ